MKKSKKNNLKKRKRSSKMIGGRKEPWEPIDDNWGYENYLGLFEVDEKLRWVTIIKDKLVYLRKHELRGSIDISTLLWKNISIPRVTDVNQNQYLQIQIKKNDKTVTINLLESQRELTTQTNERHLKQLFYMLKSMSSDKPKDWCDQIPLEFRSEIPVDCSKFNI